MKDLTPIEAGRWMDAAPKLVQDAVTSPVTRQVLGGLSQRYALHVDTAGLLEKLTIYVLLGYVGPEDFLKELIASGVSEKEAREIMTEINQKIFVPLRKEEEKGGVEAAPQQMKPVSASQPVPNTPRPAITMTPPLRTAQQQAQVPATTMRPTISNSAPLPPKTAMPLPNRPLREALQSILPAPHPLDARMLLEDHEEPHIEFRETPAATVAPAVPAAPRPVSPTPVNLPGTMPQSAVPSPAPVTSEVRPSPAIPKAEPQIQNIQSKSAAPAIPVAFVKEYSSDPYREPIDGA